jgi:transposase, IS5 family
VVRSVVSPKPSAARCVAATVEPVIGHLKDDHRMRRNHLKGREGDRINAVLAAAGYNFSLLLRWFSRILRTLLMILACAVLAPRYT